MVAAVAEVAGLNSSAPLDAAAYKESLSSVSPWSSAALDYRYGERISFLLGGR